MLLITLFACGGPSTSYTGHNTYEYVALDGTRTWKYTNESMGFDMVVEKIDTQKIDNVEIITLEYSKFDPQELLGSIKWSSDSLEGILIHGYETTNGGMDFEEPVLIAEYRMVPGEIVTTTTDGVTFTSTFEGVETCPNDWITDGDDWNCLKFTVEDDGAASTFPFVGEWWFANTWGASRFVSPNGPFGSSSPWVLSQASWQE